jgi:hypothetical protein
MMNAKVVYWLVSCLFLAAIAADLVAKNYHSAAAGTIARAVAQNQAAKAQAATESQTCMRVGDCCWCAGMTLAGLGLALWSVSWITAKGNGKRFRPLIPVVLFLAYVALQFLIV